jgi:EAL domain-containing protein (putative c-di-GMP-specific phosphodiesterase class I)
VTRHELLLRVVDETDGLQSPIQVLDTAERLDAVYDIDLWVVERAMQLAAARTDLCLQINLSGRSVGDPRLIVEVEALIQRYGVNPEQLTFEITETALIGNLSEARHFADRVRDLGCELALDDFGSGYASFRYLRLFPIDLVKIDGDYVVDLVDNPQDQVLVRALVQVCQAYGIHTVAEFVQDEPTLRMLREFGVDYVQGYLIGRPEPVDELMPPPRPRRSNRR